MVAHALLPDIDAVRRNWSCFLALGIALIALGVIAMVAAEITTLASVMLFGWLLLFGGVFEVIAAFWARQWSGILLHLLAGVLYVVVGVLMIGHPVAVAARLTLLRVAFFLTGGAFRIVAAAMLRYPNWGWTVLDGVVTLARGVMIWSGWPESSLLVIGTFVGIALVFRGWAWVTFALAVRHLPQVGNFTGQRTADRTSSPV